MLNAIRRLLNSALPVVPSFESNEGTAREQLRQAQAALIPAQQRLHEANAALERVESLIGAVGEAERAERNAQKSARESAARWAAAGAPADIPPVSDDILEEVERTKRAAAATKTVAAGAEEGLPALRAAQEQAERGLKEARKAVEDAAGEVVLETLEPIRARAGRARLEYLESLQELRAAHLAFRSPWLGVKCGAAEQLGHWLEDLAIQERRPRSDTERVEQDQDLLPYAKPFAELARRLASDADAQCCLPCHGQTSPARTGA